MWRNESEIFWYLQEASNPPGNCGSRVYWEKVPCRWVGRPYGCPMIQFHVDCHSGICDLSNLCERTLWTSSKPSQSSERRHTLWWQQNWTVENGRMWGCMIHLIYFIWLPLSNMRSLKSPWAHKHDQPDMKYSKMILMSVNAMERFKIIPQNDNTAQIN